jgi:hypothetical protein
MFFKMIDPVGFIPETRLNPKPASVLIRGLFKSCVLRASSVLVIALFYDIECNSLPFKANVLLSTVILL